MKILALLVLLASFLRNGYAQEAQVGNCELTLTRDKRSVEFIADTRKDSDLTFTAEEPCTNRVLTIKRCAVVTARKINAPRSCFGTGRPDYSEEVGIVEYWESPSQESTTR
jgi:hypothetical protein